MGAEQARGDAQRAHGCVDIKKRTSSAFAGRHLAKPKSRQREARGAPGRRSVGRGRLVAMAANVTGGPKFKMPRGASGEEVARIVEKGKARALETGASAGRASSSARPVPVAEAHVPILAVDGGADGGVYLSKSTKGRGGEIEEEGLKREARLNALRRLDPGVAKKLRELKDAEVSSSSSSSMSSSSMSSSSSSSSSGESSSGSDSSSSESESRRGKRRGRRGIGRGRRRGGAAPRLRAVTARRGPGRSSRSGAGRRSRTSCDGYGRKTRRGSVGWSAGLASRPESGDGRRRRRVEYRLKVGCDDERRDTPATVL